MRLWFGCERYGEGRDEPGEDCNGLFPAQSSAGRALRVGGAVQPETAEEVSLRPDRVSTKLFCHSPDLCLVRQSISIGESQSSQRGAVVNLQLSVDVMEVNFDGTVGKS